MFIVTPYRVAACSNSLHISHVSSSVWAKIAAASANSSSRMQSSRVFVLAFSLSKLNNFPSDLVRMKTSVLRCSDTVDSSAARKRVNKVGAKIHPCFSPWLISKGSVVDPPIDTAPAIPSWNSCIILTKVSGHPYILSNVHKVDLSTAFDRSMNIM